MRTFRRLTSSLMGLAGIPNPMVTAMSYSSLAGGKKVEIPATGQVHMTTLMPDEEDHFRSFKRIITDPKIVFTSSWIDKWFGIKDLRHYCLNFETKLRLAKEGDEHLSEALRDDLALLSSGLTPSQIALGKFFERETNQSKLEEIYRGLTSRAKSTDLGYYRFEDDSQELLGGGALAPLSKDEPIEKVDVALHILEQRRGIGSICMGILLKKAFEECGVKEVWGSSILDHPGTPTLCAKHGMIIQDDKESGMKLYFIDEAMWAASKGKAEEIVRTRPIAASTYYSGKDSEKGKGR